MRSFIVIFFEWECRGGRCQKEEPKAGFTIIKKLFSHLEALFRLFLFSNSADNKFFGTNNSKNLTCVDSKGDEEEELHHFLPLLYIYGVEKEEAFFGPPLFDQKC